MTKEANRKFSRYTSRFKVSIDLIDASEIGVGEVLNIGLGGMFLAIRFPLPKPGSRITFEVTIQQGGIPKFKGEGIVRWVRDKPDANLPVGCGIEFAQLAKEDQKSLDRIIEILRPSEDIPKS